MALKISTQVSSRHCTRRSGLAKAGPPLSNAVAISQTAPTGTMKTGTARIWAMLGGPPRTSSAAVTTRLPVTWAVKSLPRLKKPITSTMPATALSRGGSRLCNRATSGLSCDGYGQGCGALDSVDIGILPFHSSLQPCGAVGEAIDGDLRNNDAEAHRENDSDGGHAVGDRRT